MSNKTQVRRNGERISKKSLEVMKQLEPLGEGEWMPLRGIHSRIIRSLVVRDFVDWSKVTGEMTYKLSARGREALPIYTAPPSLGYQGDVCAKCGSNPRYLRPNGELSPYCLHCIGVMDRDRRVAKADAPCPRCGKPRAKSRNGTPYVYCKECKREVCRKAKARLAERVLAGETVLCTHCHQSPVQVAGNTVYNECAECRRKRARRRIFTKVMGVGTK